jgi:hypothetical protein
LRAVQEKRDLIGVGIGIGIGIDKTQKSIPIPIATPTSILSLVTLRSGTANHQAVILLYRKIRFISK